MPSTLPPKSSIAIWIATAPFLPSTSAYRLDMSVMKPIFTLPSCCACAAEAAKSPAAPSANASLLIPFAMVLVSFCCRSSIARKRLSGGARHFQSAHLLSALVVHTWSAGSLATTL